MYARLGQDKFNFVTKTANYSAKAWDYIFADTSSGLFTVELPLTGSHGDTIVIVDAAGTFRAAGRYLRVRGSTNRTATHKGILQLEIKRVKVTFIFDSERGLWNDDYPDPFRQTKLPTYGHHGIIDQKGVAWRWGTATEYPDIQILGTGRSYSLLTDRNNVELPVSVFGTGNIYNPVILSREAFLDRDGKIYVWGLDPSSTPRSIPILFSASVSFKDLMTNGFYSGVGLDVDGHAWAWCGSAYGALGFLGNNTTGSASSPVSVAGDHSFEKIILSIGGASAMGLKEDGSVWAWGYNEYGSLGDGTTNNQSSPVSVLGNHSFVDICSTSELSLGLKADGSVWAWGMGHTQLGLLADISSPVSWSDRGSFVALGGSDWWYYGLKENGSVWSWGGSWDNISEVGSIWINGGDMLAMPESIPKILDHNMYKIFVVFGARANGTLWFWRDDVFTIIQETPWSPRTFLNCWGENLGGW